MLGNVHTNAEGYVVARKRSIVYRPRPEMVSAGGIGRGVRETRLAFSIIQPSHWEFFCELYAITNEEKGGGRRGKKKP